MNMKDAVVSVLTNWKNYSDRACRSEFWYFALVVTLGLSFIHIIEIATGMVDIENDEWKIIYIATGLLESGSDELGILGGIYSLLVIPLIISVTARRLHDIGWSGWWQLPIFLVMCIGVVLYESGWTDWWVYLFLFSYLVLAVLNALPATEDENKWGRNPLM